MRSRLVLLLILLFLCATTASYSQAARTATTSEAGLVLHLPLDGNTSDVSGTGNNGILTGAVPVADRNGVPNSAYYFDGVDDRITVPDAPSLNPTDQLTIAFWMQIDTMADNYYAIIHKGGPATYNLSNREYAVHLKANYEYPYFQFEAAGDGMGQHQAFSRNYRIGQWLYFTGVVDRKNHLMRVYINGSLDSVVQDSYSTFNISEFPLLIGAETETWPDHSPFRGTLDDIRIYNRALSSSEIMLLYDPDATLPPADAGLVLYYPFSGNAQDMSGKGNNGQVYGAQLAPDRLGTPNSAYSFDGVDDKIVVPLSPSLDPYDQLTITFWMKMDSMLANYYAIIHKGGDVTGYMSNREYAVYLKYNYATPYFQVYSAGEGGGQHEVMSKSYPTGQWLFFATTIDRKSHSMTVYINGKYDAYAYDSYSSFNVVEHPLTIGWEAETVWPDHAPFKGLLDEIRIYTRALAPDEIAALYTPDTLGRIQVPASLTFDYTPAGTTTLKPLTITNNGDGPLTVTGIHTSNPVFQSTDTAFTLAPRSLGSVNVVYAPVTSGRDTATLTVTSSDPDRPEARVALAGSSVFSSAAPIIGSILDIPDDEGRQVRVVWCRSKYDGENDSMHVASYGLWRQVAGQGDLWDFIATVPAVQMPQYSYVAPTLRDSTHADGMHWSVFRVSAAVLGQPLTFFSAPDSGYSLDNRPPARPSGVASILAEGHPLLTWNEAAEGDFRYYSVYRGTSASFVPSTMSLLGTTRNNSYLDGAAAGNQTYYYRIAAVDSAGNVSPYSNLVFSTVTGVGEERGLPAGFVLRQNYPNPFNPATTISYGVPARAHVRLAVYNTLGQEISLLVDEVREAGYHEVRFDGSGLPSGLYFYRMQAGTFVETKKLAMVK